MTLALLGRFLDRSTAWDPEKFAAGCESHPWARNSRARGVKADANVDAPGRGTGTAIGGRRLLRTDPRRAGAGGDRRRGDREGQGAAGGRPGRDLRRTLDAGRPSAPAGAADPAERASQSGAHGESRLPMAGATGGARRRHRQRGRSRAAQDLVPRSDLLRAGPGQGRGPRRPPRRRRQDPVGGLGGCRSGRPGGLPRVDAGDRQRRGLLRAARLPAGRGHAPGRRRGLRPDGGRRLARRPHPPRQLRLPLRRRAGGAIRRQSRSAVGRAAGPFAAPLRDRARPRPRIRLRLAGGPRPRVRLPAALRVGGLAFRLRKARRPARTRRTRSGRGAATGRSPGEPACPASSPRAFARHSCAPPPAGTSPPRCSPLS